MNFLNITYLLLQQITLIYILIKPFTVLFKLKKIELLNKARTDLSNLWDFLQGALKWYPTSASVKPLSHEWYQNKS